MGHFRGAVKYCSTVREIRPPLGHSCDLGVGHSCDLPSPCKYLIIKGYDFALSYDLKEGKKSTPVRSVALVSKLANDRAGVEFLIDAGDVGACLFDSDIHASLLTKRLLYTSTALTG